MVATAAAGYPRVLLPLLLVRKLLPRPLLLL
jgi:hypothetical protein